MNFADLLKGAGTGRQLALQPVPVPGVDMARL
jgi:hypothetical protein